MLNFRAFFRGAALCAIILAAPRYGLSATDQYDVVVVSGSSGGFGAALAAGRMGARVALIEDTPVLGGMLSNGISNIDTFSFESLSGIFDEFRSKVREYYTAARDPMVTSPEKPAPPNHMDGRSHQANAAQRGGRWEPKVAALLFRRMMDAVPNVQVFYNLHATPVLTEGHRVIGVVAADTNGVERTFRGSVIIDATHEGDIAAWAGVPFRVGREARSMLEPHAGQIRFFNPTGEIMEGSTGRQDRAVVSYGLRLTIKNYTKDHAAAHILTSPPPEYRADDYRLAPFNSGTNVPNGKLEMNANPVGNEMQEVNWNWPEATWAERRRLYDVYKNHALGFLYYLQHERGMTSRFPFQSIESPVDRDDVDSIAEVRRMIDHPVSELDVLVCNAGRLYQMTSLQASEEDWEACLDVNLRSAWLCARAAHPLLAASAGGSIVTVASAQGLRSGKASFPYSAAKGGLLALTRTLAVEFAPRIRVNAIIPGQIESVRTEPFFNSLRDPAEARRRVMDTFPMGRLGTPEDIAKAILFLSSDDAAWITGSFLTVDGGRDAAMLDLSDLRETP